MVKKVISFTIDEKVFAQWKAYVDEECINASKFIEKILKEKLAKGGKK